MATYKVVDADKLDAGLKAVADIIRAKSGTTEKLDFPADFVSAVGNIETSGEVKEEQEKTVEITENGTTEIVADEGKTMSKVTVNTNVAFEGDIGKPYIDTSKITNFSNFCTDGARLDLLEKIDTSNGTIFASMFESNATLKSLPISQLDTSKGTIFREMFYSCMFLETIPSFDTRNGTQFGSMFYACRRVTNISLDIRNSDDCSYLFYDCEKLETVSLTTAKSNLSTSTFQKCTALKNITIGEGWAVNIYLNYSNNLTVESLHGMIENLADLTGKKAKTFQVGATNLAKIDAEHLTMLQNKNWNYS